MNYYLEEIEKYSADGIDFVPIGISLKCAIRNLFKSYTKEKFEKVQYIDIPKSPFLLYKIVDGEKRYIDHRDGTLIPKEVIEDS